MPQKMSPCPACDQPKGAGKYLCFNCWHQLAPGTQKLLNRRDEAASLRVLQLRRAIHANIPLSRIIVEPIRNRTGGKNP